MLSRILYLLIGLLLSPVLGAQTGTLFGVISDTNNSPMPFVEVGIIGSPYATKTDFNGRYELVLPSNKDYTVTFYFLGNETLKKKVRLATDERKAMNLQLKSIIGQLPTFQVVGERAKPPQVERLNPRMSTVAPTISGFEALLAAQGLGVSLRSELSSQYSVRGGNFDENLVYVNGIQVYRPFLVRSGQQEGLSFINSDLVEDAFFSAGGFEARYGDKLSSVLDITYKQPTEFAGSATLSALGGAAHIEDASENHRFTQLHGFRYRNNGYVLGALDTKGEYKPEFMDYQTYLTYDISTDLEISFLGNFSRNKYRFIPQTREAAFGTINQAIKLTVFYDGQEIDDYQTYFGAFSTKWTPKYNTELKFTTTAFRTLESETFDINGAFRLSELNRDLSSDDFGDESFLLGVGEQLDHGRNFLEATVLNATHTGKIYGKNEKGILHWGAQYQHEIINDEIHEWRMLDSAGYSVPIFPSDEIHMNELIISDNALSSNRIMGHIQYNYDWKTKDTSAFTLIGGVRSHYWDLNGQTIVSPRAQFSFRPNWRRKDSLHTRKDWTFRAAAGFYHQPPFYREYRAFDGSLNLDIKAQTAIHFVLGTDHYFTAWNRKFKFVTEVYYKQLESLIPYEIDNVRLRYYAQNLAKGQAMGVDMKLNGEVVRGVESWLSVSVMNVQEDLANDFYYTYSDSLGNRLFKGFHHPSLFADSTRHEPGLIPRPTDQRVTAALFFQDHIPKNKNFKMHMNLLFGSGLPFGPPSYERYRDTLRMPPYRRVDIGFSALLLKEERERKPKALFKNFNTIWLSAEVFNLLQIRNTVSYDWVEDFQGIQYGVPNYLTARRLNVKLHVTF